MPAVPPPVSGDFFGTYQYKHVGTPVDFTATYDSIGGNHSMLNCYLYAVTHPTEPEGPVAPASAIRPEFPPRLRRSAARSGGPTR